MIYVVNRNNVSFKPSKSIYIGRGSGIGNPYTHKSGTKAQYKCKTRTEAINNFQNYLFQQLKNNDQTVINKLNEILDAENKFGEVELVCFCKPEACHGDIIKRFLELYKKK